MNALSPTRAPLQGVGSACLCALLLASCSQGVDMPAAPKPALPAPAATAPAAASAPAEQSTMQTAIEGFTGKTAVDASKRARATLDKVNETRTRDMQEADQF